MSFSSSMRISDAIGGLLTAVMLIGLPLVGVGLYGLDLKRYLEFPPLTRYVAHADFSGWFFGFFAALNLLMAIGIIHMLRKVHRQSPPPARRPKNRWPAWGWIGVAVMLCGWLLAWTRFAWFAPLQRHTFCLPWIGYILAVNALCFKRSGRSLLTDAPGRFLMLLPSSALFWWFFEYLNRFVQNWYYVGVADFGPIAYTVHASLAFATVLPAVLSTHRLLLTFEALGPGLIRQRPLHLGRKKTAAVAIFATSALGLTLIGVLPDYLFALVWFAPLLLITALQTLAKRQTIFSPLAIGDWRSIIPPAMAALICGFFWEMWNIGSLARWEYAIPFVDRFHIFAMPVLGYGGYLPFGLECLVVGRMVVGDRHLMGAFASAAP